jgi:phospholipase/lecithinase/hemolysin
MTCGSLSAARWTGDFPDKLSAQDSLSPALDITIFALRSLTPALYTLDIGGNDIINALDEYRADKISISDVGTAVAQAEANTVDAVETLFGLGARNLLFYEVPDAGLTPHFRAEGPAWQNLASGLAESFDQTVLADLAPLERLGLTVYDVPTYADLDLVVSNPSYFRSQYGIAFKNVTGRGWTGNFTSSSSGVLRADYQDYLFFDSVHPTALAHQLTADIAYHTLTAAPSTASSATGIGGHESAHSFL